MDTNRVITGDCIDELQALPEASVHMCMTSPPYWNLRDYGVDGQLGQEADADAYVSNIADVMDEVKRVLRDDGSLWLNLGDTYANKDLQQIPARVALELQNGKNPGDVFEVTTKPFPDAHFAVYPPELCEKPIKATCPPKVCVECGTPYERDVDRKSISKEDIKKKFPERFENGPNEVGASERQDGARRKMSGPEYNEWKRNNPDEFNGWEQPCDCNTDEKEPGTALDPFAGAGTTLLKAKALGRDFLGIELNPEYADMARGRVGIDVENPDTLRGDESQTGLEHY